MTLYRLNSGGKINRNKVLNFTFDSKKYSGFEGDTLASALIANGVHLVGRSFKYHRPRGIISAGCEEPNAIVQLNTGNRTEPNIRATEILLYDGLTARSQNNWPSLKRDLSAINDMMSPIFPAGFYYKTFMWPSTFWKKYEYFIRHAAGLGKSPLEKDPDKYEHFHYHCDVLIVGGGISGLYSALLTAKSKVKVLLVDQQESLGGNIQSENNNTYIINDQSSHEWIKQTLNLLKKFSNVKIISSTTLFAYMHYNYLLAIQIIDPLSKPQQQNNIRQIIWKIRAKKVVLATGSIERPLIFDNNDRPGIMLAKSASKYINFYSAKPGNKAIIFTNNDSAYQTAIDFHKKGVEIKAIIDIRENSSGDLPLEVEKLGLQIFWSHAVCDTKGRHRISSVTINKIDSSCKKTIGKSFQLECDVLCISGGWTSTVHLFTQSRGKLTYREEDANFVPYQSFQDEISVGTCNGTFDLATIFEETLNKISEMLYNYSISSPKIDQIKINSKKYGKPKHVWLIPSLRPIGKTKMFVDLQNDVTAKDIKLAIKEGYQSIEHIKRYTTTGMATDQGKIGNISALGIISDISGRPVRHLGTTTFRPPYTPITFGAIAGRHIKEFFDIKRTTPMHQWHIDNNALFEDVGQWKRAWYYPRAKENMRQAVNREVKATRKSLGMLDASTLGKIDIKGRDANEFLNRIYTNAWSKLSIGKCRYGLMLSDDGMVIDDGVTTRLGEHHYVMTTTTGNAASVMSKLEDWLQTEWPELKVYLTSVTEQFSTISLNGPNSRIVMEKIAPQHNFSKEHFPHMSFQNLQIDGIYCRVMRISFTGELCYEINVPSSNANSLWKKCMEAGKEFDITPYGTEAMHVLRAEKGFIIVGQETDGSVTPVDLNMDWIISKKKYDFIGKRSLSRSDTIREDRKQLVGILTEDPNDILEEGAQLVEKITQLPMAMVGHITSSYFSPNLGRSFALALVKNGKNKKDQKLFAPMPNKNIKVLITSPVFIDPKNERLCT